MRRRSQPGKDLEKSILTRGIPCKGWNESRTGGGGGAARTQSHSLSWAVGKVRFSSHGNWAVTGGFKQGSGRIQF